jgi:hypothetical protein
MLWYPVLVTQSSAHAPCLTCPAQITCGNTRFLRAWQDHTQWPEQDTFLDQDMVSTEQHAFFRVGADDRVGPGTTNQGGIHGMQHGLAVLQW